MSDLAVVGLSILGGSCALAAVFLGVAWFRKRMSAGWTRTTGIVINRRTGSTDGGMPAIYPTFRWEDQNGQTHQRTSNMRQSLGPRPSTPVPILYDPQSPNRAIVDTFVQSGRIFWMLGFMFLGFGVVIGGFLLYGAATMN